MAADNLKASGISGHKRLPEIRQGLSLVAHHQIGLTFVPRLASMISGIHATLYARVKLCADLHTLFGQRYANKTFVDVRPATSQYEPRSVRGLNSCRIAVYLPQDVDTVVMLLVIDNLVKGVAAQAVQKWISCLVCPKRHH